MAHNDYEDVFPEKSFGVRDAEEEAPDVADINDGDDDAGIFADLPSRESSVKSFVALVVGTIVFLSAIGVGGYFMVDSNPAVVDQIKQNLGMEPAEAGGSILPTQELSADLVPAVQEAGQGENPREEPLPQPEVIRNIAKESPHSESAQMISPPATEGAVDAASLTAKTEEQPASPLGSGAEVLSTPEPIPPVLSPAQEGKAEEEAGAKEVPAMVSQGITPDLPPADPVTDKKSEDTPHEGKVPDSSAPADSALVVPPVSGEVKSAGVTPPAKKPETVYYDSPSGKILSDIPAPRLDPKRGQGGSIIVVTGAGPVGDSIQTDTLDAQVVAAGRALKLGRLERALEMYENLYRQNPRDSRILMGRAVTLQKLGNEAAAISAYEELLGINQDNPDAVLNLAGLIRKTYPAVALGKLLDLRQKYPENAGVAAQIGVAYADSGNLQDAYKYLSIASELKPNDPQHYYNMAIIAERAKQPQRAIALYEKALEVDAIYGTGRGISRDKIYDRLARLRGN